MCKRLYRIMFIRWSIFGFLLNRSATNRQHKQSVFDDSSDKNNIYVNESGATVLLNGGRKSIAIEKMGSDERYPIVENDNTETLFKINMHLQKMLILNYLRNNNVSIHEKVLQIQHHNILQNEYEQLPNITNGGLMKDWDFTM